MAAGQMEPTDDDWRMLGVEPRPVAVDDDPEFAYGVWRTLSWLLGVREDFPIYTSWHRAADLPPDRPHLYAPLRGGEPNAAWFAAEQAARRVGVLAVAPLGLCFLPAFVLLGVVPVVIGLAGPLLATL